MAIDARAALREGAADLASARGAILYVLFTVFALASLPVHQTVTEDLYDWMIAVAEISPEEIAVPPTPLALELSLPVIAGLMVLVFLAAEALRFVAIRAFASESDAAIPMATVTERALPTFATLLAASVLVQALVYAGVLLFVLPGVVAFFLTFFVRQAVLLDDAGPIAALRRSIGVVVDGVLQVVAIAVSLFVISFVIGLPTLFLAPGTTVRAVLGSILATVVTVYGVAVATRAYLQLDEEGEDAMAEDGADQGGALDADDLAA